VPSANYKIDPSLRQPDKWQLWGWDRDDYQWYKVGKPSSMHECEEAAQKLSRQATLNAIQAGRRNRISS
jgi:hypothetical protein